jgi:uncharacterized protein YcbK (DUF882 family)
MAKLSEHFKRSEFRCKCGCGADTVDYELLRVCEEVREYTGAPVRVMSGHRCKKHNSAVGGAKRSQHLYGRAADLQVDNPKDVYDYLNTKYPNTYGLGLYARMVHVDTSSRRTRW